KHQNELAQKGVAYINTDSSGKGWLSMQGSHSLQAFLNDVGRDVPDPQASGRSALEAKRDHDLKLAKTKNAKDKLIAGDLPIGALGSGSDYTAFVDYLTIASANVSFGGDGDGGVYHSVYDSFYWFMQFSDGNFAHGTALSRFTGTALLRLANADVLPFEFTSLSKTLTGYVDDLRRLLVGKDQSVDLDPIRKSLKHLDASAQRYEVALKSVQ